MVLSSFGYSLLQRSSSSDELSAKDPDTLSSLEPLCAHCQRPLSDSHSTLPFWAIVISLLSLSLNCIIFLASSKLSDQCMDPMLSVTNDSIHLLRRPTPFIGFDNITRPVPPVQRELINFPQVIQQVNKDRPGFVYDDDPLRYMSRRGLVSPEERRVQATDKVSTLAQFRAIDYGMERCEIHVRFPINTSTAASSGRPFLLSVNRLESRIPINTKKLSYANKPTLVSTVAQIRVDPSSAKEEVHWWQRFDCPWDELFTFELACFGMERLGDGAEDCWVEWWQNREGEDPRSGMKNSPSILTRCTLLIKSS
ncbi:hypothetical protein ARMSODRAFT_1018153 [Armillaria solidipes]|uniref:Ubiquitin 3 binding protein But2 C-terminal domain-containing protein n=1 Tax=Armillaria solidipes TaxID=1076256 RepID=A0A2H3BGP2_9AGAR|nr:hypothetical protein ARMSODRAFT_1018153 [Armillaria solidipes]